jgi:DNA-binding CsgD family transcriptional regulator
MKREGTDIRRQPQARVAGQGDSRPMNHLERAREAFGGNAWRDAYDAYLLADAAAGLEGEDLDRLAMAAYLVGRDTEFLEVTERSHRAHVAANRAERAARDAFWLALISLLRGEVAKANGWTARGERLVCDRDCAERAYLSMTGVEQLLRGGNFEAARAQSAENVVLGLRYGDMDLVAAARQQQGRAEIELGQHAQGLKLLDEIMLAAVGGELSPMLTGLMYCSVIDTCRAAQDWSRAREWTAALSKWCDRQGGMVAFTDVCRVHRAEILRLQGDWQQASEEARRVCGRGEHADRPPPGAAYYEQGEIHRLRGESREAEEAYRTASRRGFDPQPGLALLRLAQGRTDAASAGIRRLVGAAGTTADRGRFLPACFEILLAIDELDEAQRACEELETLCAGQATEWLLAQASQARGALCLRRDDACAALAPLREAFECWQRLGVPFEAARVRALIAQACERLGDAEAGALERAAARAEFERLGARGELERLSRPARPGSPAGTLTARELEVLRLIAQGLTNKMIANRLALSERTIDRHVGNILGKLNVSSRVAATAYACAHKLV